MSDIMRLSEGRHKLPRWVMSGNKPTTPLIRDGVRGISILLGEVNSTWCLPNDYKWCGGTGVEGYVCSFIFP